MIIQILSMNIKPFKYSLLFKVLPLIVGTFFLKITFHYQGWEFLELNTLFTAIISANVFLLGFLLAGVLSDFKESERLPGELSVGIDALADEMLSLYRSKKIPAAKEGLFYLLSFIEHLKRWFHKTERTHVVMEKIRGFNDFFLGFEPHTQANFIVRLKQEQSGLRRNVSRIDTIRDTSFVSSAYNIAEINSVLLIIGLLILDLEPFSNSLFFTAAISTLFIYMLVLIRDLDNPFGFYEGSKYENVQIKLLLDTENRLREEVEKISM